MEEKQHLQTRIDAAKKEAANRINEDSRMAELAAYLEEHLSGFQQYDDGIVRKMIERVTVVDEETIRVKFRYSDLEIEQTIPSYLFAVGFVSYVGKENHAQRTDFLSSCSDYDLLGASDPISKRLFQSESI